MSFTHGVASGDVTDRAAITWTRVDGPAKIEVSVFKDPGLTDRVRRKSMRTDATRDFTVKLDVTGLKPDTQYYYRFLQQDLASCCGSQSDVGTFKTAPKKNTAADVNLTYTSDSDGTKVAGVPQHGNFDVLAAAEAENADFFAYVGNTIYGDSSFGPPAVTLSEYRDKYKEVRTYPNVPSLLKSTSTYALMDDREVVNDYDGQTVDPARYAAGRQAFLEYMPVREKGLIHDSSCVGDPLYREYKWGSDVEVFILDERACRSADVQVTPCGGDFAPTLTPTERATFPFSLFLTPLPPPGCVAAINDPNRTVLGPKQKKAFKKGLLKSNAKWKIVLSEYPFQQFHTQPYDRWEGYEAERSEILNHIRDNGIENVVSLAGNIRATLQNQLYIDRNSDPDVIGEEFATGPIGAETLQQEVFATAGAIGVFAYNSGLNTESIECRHIDKYTYGLVDINQAGGTATVSSRDIAGAVIADQNVPTTFCTRTLGP